MGAPSTKKGVVFGNLLVVSYRDQRTHIVSDGCSVPAPCSPCNGVRALLQGLSSNFWTPGRRTTAGRFHSHRSTSRSHARYRASCPACASMRCR
jgi:hypothetical protein